MDHGLCRKLTKAADFARFTGSRVKLMTRDNYYSLQRDSICNCLFPFGITPSRLEDIAPQYSGGAQGG